MTSLQKHSGFGIWLILLIFSLTKCVKESPATKEKENYTGYFGNVSDIDGNKYQVFGLETQIWMSQNLRTTRLNNGLKINLVTDNNQWKSLNKPGYCWYNNDSIKNAKFGALYNLFTVATGSLCPTGWHVPDQNDWKILINSLGGENVAGGKMKSHYPGSWYYPPNFSDRPTFLAMPGGYRNSAAKTQFTNIDTAGYWWTYISESDSGFYSIFLKALSTSIHSSYFSKNDGLSIRCIKD